MAVLTKPHGDPARSRLLLVGHDPRLQKSDTIAPVALFADYFVDASGHVRQRPSAPSEAAKYDLAKAAFDMVAWLTDSQVEPSQVVVTNLCNEALPHAPARHTVLITEEHAQRGIADLSRLLSGSSIQLVVAMSQQVNYWLQRLGFCSADLDFLKEAEPSARGTRNDPPYYQPRRLRAFTRVCGRRFDGPACIPVFPVLHVNSWNRPTHLATYAPLHDRARGAIGKVLGDGR